MYDYKITAHARLRWDERFPNVQNSIEDCVDHSQKLGDGRRKLLRKQTRSEVHLARLQKDSGFFYRIHRNGAVFVLDNLTLVTVFRWDPMRYIYKGK